MFQSEDNDKLELPKEREVEESEEPVGATIVEEEISEEENVEEEEDHEEEEELSPPPQKIARVVLDDDSDEEEDPPFLPMVDGVEEVDLVRFPLHDDDGEGVSQHESVAQTETRERREAKTKVTDDLPEDMKYTMYDGSQTFEVKNEFQCKYNGYHKCLRHLRGFTPEELAFDQWKDVMEYIIVHCYNKKIQQERTHIKKLTLGVLCKWYGIRMFMTIVKRRREADYWTTLDLGDTLQVFSVASIMSYEDFKEIKANLRFEDYAEKTEEDMKDKAWKVRTIFNMMKAKCRHHMPAPGEFISVDEAMMKYFGRRCPITKSMPAKPIKRGFLFYCGVDYETKWVFDINLSDSGYDDMDFSNIIVSVPPRPAVSRRELVVH